MYKYFFSNSSLASVILKIVNNENPCIQIFDFNKAFEDVLGINDIEIRNTQISQLLTEFGDIEYAILKGDNSKQYFEYYSISKDESYIVEVDITGIDILMRFKEIRDPEIALIKLKDSEKSFRSIFNNVADAIYIQNTKGEFLDVNNGALEMYGYKKCELIGKTHEMISANAKNDLKKIAEFISKAYNGEPQQFEFWGKRKNGEVFPKLVRVSAGYYFGKKVILAYAIDISKRKKEEEKVKYSLKYQKLISQISSNFIGIYNIEESINNLLKSIGVFSQASRSYVFILNESEDTLINSYHWCKDNYNCNYNYLKELPLKTISYWNERLSNGECVIVEDTEKLPQVAIKEKLIKNGVKSIITVPLMNDNQFMGLVGFDNVKELEFWKEHVINLLIISSKIIENVIRRFKAKERLKDSEAYNKTLFYKLHIPLVVMRADTYEYIECNEAAVKIYGFKKKEELIGFTLADVSCKTQYNDEDSIELAKEKIDEAIEKGSVIFDWKHQRPNGEIWDAQVHFVYITYKNEKLLQFSLLDVTEQHIILHQNKKLSIAIMQSANTIVITDLDGNIDFANPKFTETTGYTIDEAIGKNPRILNSGVQSKKFYNELWDTITSGKIWKGEFCNKTKSGKLFWEFATITPLINDSNKAYGYLAIKEDITKHKEVEQKLIKNEKNLRIANASKDKFFSIIAHDLINPIGNIKNFSELLQSNFKEFDVDKQLNYISIIAESSKHTLNLLQDLLEWSRIQNKQIVFNPEVVELTTVVNNNFELLQSNAMAKKNMLMSKVSEGTQVFADKNTINTVFRNLISNSIKFTENGIITVTSKFIDGFVEITVRDTGVGISPEKIGKLFKIEENTSTIGTANERGTGLGLVMCKNFIEGNSGEIRVESTLEEGSSFIFTLPKIPV